jgi:adenine phosphoribosyltransferase
MGPILATRLHVGFVPIRKLGKLPAAVYEESYGKEYGMDTIQIHKDALNEDDVVLLHDDLLATGGTMFAACKLVQKFNPQKIIVNFIVELEDLKGRLVFEKNIRIDSVIKYDI